MLQDVLDASYEAKRQRTISAGGAADSRSHVGVGNGASIELKGYLPVEEADDASRVLAWLMNQASKDLKKNAKVLRNPGP